MATIDMRKKKEEEKRVWDTELAKAPFGGDYPSGIKYRNTAPETSPAVAEPVIKGVPLKDESPYKNTPSNYDIYPNTNYAADALKAESEGRFNDAAYLWGMRDEKIDAGYGGNYAKFNPYVYNSKNADKIADLRNQWENYEDFSYDPTEDEAYKALAGVYSKNAKDASANALGLAAAANGGQMSSNAIIASNLAYQNKMAGLEAEIPQLRELAYQMYLGDKNDLRTTLNDYMYQEEQDYNRWNDAMKQRIENQIYANEMATNAEETKRRNAVEMLETLGYATGDYADELGIEEGTKTASKEYNDSLVDYNNRSFERSVTESDRDYLLRVISMFEEMEQADKNYALNVYSAVNPRGGVQFTYKNGMYDGDTPPPTTPPTTTTPTTTTPTTTTPTTTTPTTTTTTPTTTPTTSNYDKVKSEAFASGMNVTDSVSSITKAYSNGELTQSEAVKMLKEINV